jgi:hypothetical protein
MALDMATIQWLLEREERKKKYGPTRGSKLYPLVAGFYESEQNYLLVKPEETGHRDLKSLASGLTQLVKRMRLADKLEVIRDPKVSEDSVVVARREWIETMRAQEEALRASDETRDLFRERLVGTLERAGYVTEDRDDGKLWVKGFGGDAIITIDEDGDSPE